jgi:hypothetical protein
VLGPTTLAGDAEAEVAALRTTSVNVGLSYRLDAFGGYEIETEMELDGGQQRRTRVTYRRIDPVSGGAPSIERYLESETTLTTEPFGTVQVLRRERSRVVIRLNGLGPISARGETAQWSGSEWTVAEHDLRFEQNRVVGLLADSTGQSVQLDRELPPGTILQDIRDLAFAVLDADSLVGRSVEFTIFDPRLGRIDRDRYDVVDTTSVELDGTTHRALRVTLATGLDNETLFVRRDPPRVLLRRVNDDGSQVELVTSIEILPARPATGR